MRLESAANDTVGPADADGSMDEALGSGPGLSGHQDTEDSGHTGSDEVIVGNSWKRAVNKPSAEEVRRHMTSHVPYRSWCEHCVRGKAKESPHIRVSREEWESEPVYAWDYVYLKSNKGNAESSTGPGECHDLGTSQ